MYDTKTVLLYHSLQPWTCQIARPFDNSTYTGARPGPKDIKLFLCSSQLSTKFILLINVKMPTIVGILIFISMINTTSERLKARNSSFVSILVFMSSWNFVLSWVVHEKFYNLRPRCSYFGLRFHLCLWAVKAKMSMNLPISNKTSQAGPCNFRHLGVKHKSYPLCVLYLIVQQSSSNLPYVLEVVPLSCL